LSTQATQHRPADPSTVYVKAALSKKDGPGVKFG